MAKQQDRHKQALGSIISGGPQQLSVTPSSVKIPAEGRTLPTSVGLKESEVQLLDQVAGELGVARNAVMRYALRDFLRRYMSGEINLTAKVQEAEAPKRKLQMD